MEVAVLTVTGAKGEITSHLTGVKRIKTMSAVLRAAGKHVGYHCFNYFYRPLSINNSRLAQCKKICLLACAVIKIPLKRIEILLPHRQ